MLELVLVLGVVTSGLLAGFFFAYWCSVMVGLKNASDATFVETMQNINAVLPNGRFVIPFFGPVILAAASTWLGFSNEESATAWWCVASLVLSVLTFGITASQNVPLNQALAAAERNDDGAARTAFEGPWNRWNDLRTSTSALAFITAVMALVFLV